VVICAFFTSFTGASGVTILALGGILFTVLSKESGYPKNFSIGLLTSVGGIGLLFPPSLPLILTGVTTRTDIRKIFTGSLVPGIIMVLAMIVFGVIISKKVKIPIERFRIKEVLSSLKESALEIILPVFLLLGYFRGIFTISELGAISVIYVFIAEVLIHRDIKFKDIHKVFLKALPIVGGILCIIAAAKALSYAIVDFKALDYFTGWMHRTVESKYLFLLLLNLALLVVGCLMDIFSAILVVLPLLVPLGEAYGIDPTHLSIIFIINMEVGFLTPPVGLNLFLSSYRFKEPFTKVCRYVLPFLVVQLAIVLLVTYAPSLSTFIPGFIK
jgi:tripartite ATP-independent transporter DctM subunit